MSGTELWVNGPLVHCTNAMRSGPKWSDADDAASGLDAVSTNVSDFLTEVGIDEGEAKRLFEAYRTDKAVISTSSLG